MQWQRHKPLGNSATATRQHNAAAALRLTYLLQLLLPVLVLLLSHGFTSSDAAQDQQIPPTLAPQQQQQQEQQQQLPLGFCKLQYSNVSFIGPQLSIAAGNLSAISYHRFGPLAANSRNNESPFTGTPRRPLLLMMGYGGNMYTWGVPALQALAQNREVIIFNYPGFGNSSFPSDIGPNKNLTLAEVADDVVNFIGALQLPLAVDVLGYSQGGIIAMYISIHHSTMFNNLVILESTTYGPYVPTSEMMAASPGSADQAAAAFASNNTAIVGSLFPKGLSDPGACVVIASLIAFASFGSLQPVPSEILQQYAQTGGPCFSEMFDALPMVRNRMMFVHGQQDTVIPVAAAEKAAGQVSGAWFVVFGEAGHGLPFSHANRLAAVVNTFLDTVDESMSTEVADLSVVGRPLPVCA